MIITRLDGKLLVVRQPEHGNQTGLFAASWGNEDVATVTDQHRATLLAARHHDDGWAVWEQHPTIDPETSRPLQFVDVRPVEHLAAYRAGIIRAAQLDPWAGLLVSMHGAGLYNDRYGTFRLEEMADDSRFSAEEKALVAEFLADMADLQERLAAEALGHALPHPASDNPAIRYAYLLLQVWDRLSLQFAFRHAADGAIAPLPTGIGGESITLTCRNAGPFALALDPYPFVEDSLAMPVVAQLVPDRPYREPEDFLAELAAAPRTQIDCRVTRLGSGRG